MNSLLRHQIEPRIHKYIKGFVSNFNPRTHAYALAMKENPSTVPQDYMSYCLANKNLQIPHKDESLCTLFKE